MDRPHASPKRGRAGVLGGLLAAATWFAGGCHTDPGVEQTMVQYAEAVQARDLDALFCLSAGAAGSADLGSDAAQRRETFADWAEAMYEAYEAGRDEGRVELDGHGIVLVKLLALGRGTFSASEPAEAVAEGGRTVRATLRFGYDAIDLSRYSPGTTLYFNGAPVGVVHTLVIPRWSTEVTFDVLDSVQVEWSLVRQRAADGCPEGWAVAGIRPVDGSEVVEELTWEF